MAQQNTSSLFDTGIKRAAASQRGPSQPGLQTLSVLLAKRKARAIKVAAGCCSIALVLGIIHLLEAAIEGGWQGMAEFWGLIFLALGIGLYFLIRFSSLSYREYFSLPDSSTHYGKPRCIYCGHAGIYTHGQYKSSTTFHDCAKCGQTLYTS